MAPPIDREKPGELTPRELAESIRNQIIESLRNDQPFIREVKPNVAAWILRINQEDLARQAAFGFTMTENSVLIELQHTGKREADIFALAVSPKDRAHYLRDWYSKLSRAFQQPMNDDSSTSEANRVIRDMATPFGLDLPEDDQEIPRTMFSIAYPDLSEQYKNEFSEMRRIAELTLPDSPQQVTREDIASFLSCMWEVIGATGESHVRSDLYSPERLQQALTGGKIPQLS